MRAEALPARHDLVWLAPGWRGALAAPAAAATLSAFEAWISRDRPAVACRRERGSPDDVALGIALPPGGGPRRVSLLVRREAVARSSSPLTLDEVLPSAPIRWRAPLAALDRDARYAGLILRVYGSLAWQHLSGAPFVTERSDVDLLAEVRDAGELRHALSLLHRPARPEAPPLDGELLLPGGRAIAWRELARRPARVLVKSAAAVALEPIADALGPLAEGLS
jgi:phosphoribosyl-dephospho-CoA transferase